MGKQSLGEANYQPDSKSIRKAYEEYSVEGFYNKFGDDYKNPHELIIQQIIEVVINKWQLDLEKVLDLACGSGEVTLTLKKLGATDIDGIDPYTYNAYLKRTGQLAERYTFEEIASGILGNRCYSLIVCSFALHLVEESRLPFLVYQLSLIANTMVIITPHKRPQLKPEWGWICVDEIVIDRVRVWLFQTP
ncbi:class I SAM-dependent methyltransferase [Argonema galeatum]|uniref:class I SAM-dependent methyltransferase n=1 Tax=Argonema galeatum TaxID=2942762 RepID=UPI002012E6EB|nr:class I SAM-dependent methyltransferase [Argonema galeatum]MCL1464968.1 class I SAM-dependent methyltransferase [Argonema galeatum A003/A1]